MLGIILQEDWRFEIEVMDKGSASFMDTSIGKTMIDLELRRWSTLSALAKLTLQQEMDTANSTAEAVEKSIKNQRKKVKGSDIRERYA